MEILERVNQMSISLESRFILPDELTHLCQMFRQTLDFIEIVDENIITSQGES